MALAQGANDVANAIGPLAVIYFLGVGLAGGIEAVNFGIVIQIMLYWVLTVPAAAITSMVIFKILELVI